MAGLSIQEALTALERIGEVLELPAEPEEAGRALEGLKEGIRFEGVSFSYGGETVLDDVSLEITAGTKVALVGQSGCGKTTLLNLLLRFYEPTSGEIFVDGVRIWEYSRHSLRSIIRLIQQEAHILSGTFAENIGLAEPKAPPEKISFASKIAKLHDFVAGLPDGLSSVVGERGGDLSGGQRQRLAIARASIGQPQVIILDEATSNLDARMEREIQMGLFRAHPNATFLLVSHRLSAIRDADRIYVLSEGKIVEQGSHSELVAEGGVYAALWQA